MDKERNREKLELQNYGIEAVVLSRISPQVRQNGTLMVESSDGGALVISFPTEGFGLERVRPRTVKRTNRVRCLPSTIARAA